MFMRSLKVVDVTLRDGGCVNDFNFGIQYMQSILKAEESAKVDCIEVGYLDDKLGTAEGRSQFDNECSVNTFIKKKEQNLEYLVMMDYGKFNPCNLSIASKDGIDGIRLAFHQKDLKEVIAVGKTILAKEYKLYIQPMLTIHYSDRELLDLVDMINTELPKVTALYIVDSFGEMRTNDLARLFSLMDNNLNKDIALGFHSHNNLQMSYSNAISFIQFQTERNLYVDSSILGMGKGAGNLNTELLLEHLNLYYGKSYNLMPLMEVIDEVMSPLKAEFHWGYSIEFYLSSRFHTSPSYADYFYNKHSLTVAQLSELLSSIKEEKKISFDREYAREIYQEYKGKKRVDDEKNVQEIRTIMQDRIILLVAPGRNAKLYRERVNTIISEGAISIGLNNYELFPVQYVLITRSNLLQSAINSGRKVITLSNIAGSENNCLSLDYRRWMVSNDEIFESAGVIALRLLEYCKPKKIILAGFDGFSIDVNKNYYDKRMRFVYSEKAISSNNKFMKKYINELRSKVEVEFLTPSSYEG